MLGSGISEREANVGNFNYSPYIVQSESVHYNRL